MSRKQKKSIIITLTAIVAVVLAIWTVWGNITVGVTHYTVASNRLPASFNHYKIAVISDLHNAEFGKNNSRLIKLIEEQKPSIIAITGDLADYRKTDINTAGKLVNNLSEIAPCYYVTGNHEAWLGEQYQKLEKVLLDEGVVILHNKSVQLVNDKDSIHLVGIDDPNFSDKDFSIEQSLSEANNMNSTNDYRILLSHRPEAFAAYVSENIDLILSGHAHGGQFRLPFIGGVAAPNQGLFPKYDAGIYSENNTTMVVSRGIGNSIIPIRFNNRPEIISIELVCE